MSDVLNYWPTDICQIRRSTGLRNLPASLLIAQVCVRGFILYALALAFLIYYGLIYISSLPKLHHTVTCQATLGAPVCSSNKAVCDCKCSFHIPDSQHAECGSRFY